MRTFTYLNLFGYLTDAVVVNRVFPDEVDGTYFGAWRELQQEQLELVRVRLLARARAARAVLRARGARAPRCSTGSADELFADARRRPRVLHATVSQQLRQDGERAELRLELPFATKGDVSLKKIGLELVVRVGDAKRVIELPSVAGRLPARRRRRSPTARWSSPSSRCRGGGRPVPEPTASGRSGRVARPARAHRRRARRGRPARARGAGARRGGRPRLPRAARRRAGARLGRRPTSTSRAEPARASCSSSCGCWRRCATRIPAELTAQLAGRGGQAGGASSVASSSDVGRRTLRAGTTVDIACL